MKKSFLTIVALCLCGFRAFAQMGGQAGPAASFDNGMEKLFGANPVFSATMQTKMDGPNGPMTVKTKMFFDHENSRTEMNMADAQGSSLPPDAVSQMQAIGMDKVVSISLADKKNIYVVYPNIHSYVGMEIPGSGSDTNEFKTQITKIGDGTVDGHPCIENKAVVWSGDQTNDFTVWNATDLKNFPVQITMSQQGVSVTISFQNVSFDKLDPSLFRPPANYTRYGTIQDLMQSAMMNHPSGMPGLPGTPAPPSAPTPNQ